MSHSIEVVLPDIGDYKDVPVVEINVSVGDEVTIDMPLLSIESDKATMEVPSPAAGTVAKLMIEVGARVSQGSILMILEGRGESTAAPPAAASAPQVEQRFPQQEALSQRTPAAPVDDSRARAQLPQPSGAAHASPSVRALARELGVALDSVVPTGPKGRILREDVAAFVNGLVRSRPAMAPAPDAPVDWPKVDFERYGAVERLSLTRIQKLTGANLSRNWSVIPHVTNFDKADVTDAEAFRQLANAEAAKATAKLTMVSLLIKAAALALQKYPRFNSSLDGDELILKHYVHIGFAVDTPKGLVVPVIRDCDKKGLRQIAAEMRSLADKALAGQLAWGDMQGGCFSVSSLGGVGGQGFSHQSSALHSRKDRSADRHHERNGSGRTFVRGGSGQFHGVHGDGIFVAHNVSFDYGFMAYEFERIARRFRFPKLCTCAGMRRRYPGHKSYGLGKLCEIYGISLATHHRALCVARASAHLLNLINKKRSEEGYREAA